jgi:hypothetical protein
VTMGRRPATPLVLLDFRVLWWLVAFEASYQVYRRWKSGPATPGIGRAAYWRTHRQGWREWTARALETYAQLRRLP